MIIGITGGIACGKTAVSDYLKQQGYDIIDADQVVHDLYEEPETIEFLQETFNSTDRMHIRQQVFSDSRQKKRLEHYIHPKVYRSILLRMKTHRLNKPKEHLFVVIPLLFETRQHYDFDSTCCIHCKPDVQMQRLLKRPNMNKDLAQKIIDQQLPIAYKISQCDHSIENNETLKELHQKTNHWLNTLQ